MELISDRLKTVKPSPTLAVTQKADELKKLGKKIISLGAGEPDFNTPKNINEAAIEAINKGFTKYTNVSGIDILKEAICEKLLKENNLEYNKDNIIVGTGAKQVIYNLFMSSLNSGDEVIIPAPYWVSYPDIVELSSGKSVIIESYIEDDFKITSSKLENAITEKTKWLILNSPNNPTGSVYSKSELQSLGKILEKFPNVNIMTDDIYEKIIFDGIEFYNIASVVPSLKDRVFIVNGVSKSYAMTGWRIGFGAGNKNLINAMGVLQSQSTSNPCSISQYASVEAYRGPQDFLIKNTENFQLKRDVSIEILSKNTLIQCNIPKGAFYIFSSCKDTIGKITPRGDKINDCNDFSSFLLEYAEVAVVPGSAFGLKNHFRISIATDINILKEACNRINEACSLLK